MKPGLFILLIVAGMIFCSDDAKAQNRNQAKQTVSFGVYVSNMDSPMMQRTITVAPVGADSKPSSAISLRSLIPFRPSLRTDIPLREVYTRLATRELLVTISD